MQGELVDEDPAAAATHRGSAIACSSRIEAVCFGACSSTRSTYRIVRFPAHSAGRTSTRTNDGREVRRRARDDRLRAALEPGAAGPVEPCVPLRLDLELAREQVADPRPGMRVQVRDAAQREVDPVAADDPVGERVELDEPGEQGALRLALVVVELPDERGAVDLGGAEPRLAALQVVDDAVAADRLDARLEAVEGESQWKYWPPSMTMVWPVTNDADGPRGR